MGWGFSVHNHTEFSNLRLIDCINKPESLIDRAIELGYSGLAITDHECLSAHPRASFYAEKYPDFKLALGNEIYLTETREKAQKYYHFILIAKDAEGHKQLSKLSSIAWYNSYNYRGMTRVPLLKSELQEVVEKNKGHLIATTACIGGELGQTILKMQEEERKGDYDLRKQYHDQIVQFLKWCRNLFGDDFYIECAPALQKDQIEVNKVLKKLSKLYSIPLVFGCDAHYLRKEDRYVHKSFLNSKEGEREVDAFYEYSYLMSQEEVFENLQASFQDEEFTNNVINNSLAIADKIKTYSLRKTQKIPQVKIPEDYQYEEIPQWVYDKYEFLRQLSDSLDDRERYWLSECAKGLQRIGKNDNDEYWGQLDKEADIILTIGKELNVCLFQYFNTFQHYIDLFWECGSIVGPGRGSATGFLSNYLLGITQMDPVAWGLKYWRFLNKVRYELPDVDIDLCSSRRPEIFRRIREERGECRLLQVATFGTESTKSAVQTACRGYVSEDLTDGIDVDTAQYFSSLVPSERGFVWPLHDMVYGNTELNRSGSKVFVNAVNQYPRLLEIMFSIEGLISRYGIHASGTVLFDEDPWEMDIPLMRAPNGSLITQYELHDAEACGVIKYDFLITEVSDKITAWFQLLEEFNKIPKEPLRVEYNKYLHPDVINTSNPEIWNKLASGSVLDVFQFNSGVGLAIAKKLRPQNPLEMTAANAMVRLMSEPGVESQQDRFYRIKNQGIQVFDQEMRNHNLPEKVIAALHKHCDEYWGCVPIQEQMMEILMDEDLAKFSLKEANDARKIVAKKQMSRIPELREKFYSRFDNKNIADYVWDTCIAPSLG